MPRHPEPPRPPEYGRWERPPHEEILELIDRRFDEIKRDLEEIKAKLR